jgi:hypothetical protein
MTEHDLHPLARDYLARLRRAGGDLAPDRLTELAAELECHLAEAIEPGASDEQALEVIERLGPPGDIIEAERPSPATTAAGPPRRSRREWATLVLLPLGGFVLGVGWVAGLVLLWTSRLWTTRDKLIGTLVVPGGIASVVVVALLAASKRACVSGGPLPAPRCTTHSAGPLATSTGLTIVLIALCVLGPLVSSIYLARRAQGDASVGRRAPVHST